jgi:amino acid permease
MQYLGFTEAPYNSRIFWTTAVGWLIELPLASFSNMSALRFSSLVGTAGIAYITVVTLWFASGGTDLPEPEQELTFWLPASTKHTSMGGLAEGMSIFMYAFGCVTSLPTLVLELQDRSLRRIDIMIVVVIVASLVIYLVMGVSGAVAFGASVEGNCLLSYPSEPGSIGGKVTILARLAIVFNVMGSIPLEMHPLRTSISVLIFGKPPTELTISSRAAVTMGLFLASWGMALVVTSLDEVMSIVGSTANNLLGFFFPALFFCMGVKNQSELSLQDHEESAEQGVVQTGSVVTHMILRQKPLRRAAWSMAITSLILMPVLTAGEVYKFMYEQH